MENRKILIVEDESQIARFLSLELKHEGYITDIAYDGVTGLEMAEKNKYDIIILDIMLPKLDGMEVCKEIRTFSDVPIIMVTSKMRLTDKVMGLDIGADDYVTKPFEIEELLARIRANIRKNNMKRKINKKELKVDGLIMDISAHMVIRDGIQINLSKKEFDLLEYLMRNVNILLNRDQILENVWDYNYDGDTNVVDVYIKHIRRKVDEGFDNKLIHTVRGFGYMLKKSKN